MPSGGLSVPAPPAARRRAETHSEIQPSATNDPFPQSHAECAGRRPHRAEADSLFGESVNVLLQRRAQPNAKDRAETQPDANLHGYALRRLFVCRCGCASRGRGCAYTDSARRQHSHTIACAHHLSCTTCPRPACIVGQAAAGVRRGGARKPGPGTLRDPFTPGSSRSLGDPVRTGKPRAELCDAYPQWGRR